MPDSIKEKLIDRVLEFTDDATLDEGVIITKYLLSISAAGATEDGAQGDVATERDLTEDAAALARVINANHTPKLLRSAIVEALDQLQTGISDEPDVLKVSYPIAVSNYHAKEAEGSAE